jgi:hypothetical protein
LQRLITLCLRCPHLRDSVLLRSLSGFLPRGRCCEVSDCVLYNVLVTGREWEVIERRLTLAAPWTYLAWPRIWDGFSGIFPEDTGVRLGAPPVDIFVFDIGYISLKKRCNRVKSWFRSQEGSLEY